MNWNYSDNYRKLGLNIAYYRKLANFTQIQFCETVDISRSYISKIELGNIGVSLDVLFKMAEVLEIPVHKFLEFKD